MRLHLGAVALVAASIIPPNLAAQNLTSSNLYSNDLTPFKDRPDGCPPCFDCNVDDFNCLQFAPCESTGRCSCQPGFGGEDCSKPVCGALGKKHRPIKGPRMKRCACDDGWSGLNCNVCEADNVCNAFTPDHQGGACYKGGIPQKEFFSMCSVTNPGIVKQLKGEVPEATLSCNAKRKDCNFQFWIDAVESFYCGLTNCTFSLETEPDRNTTKYACEKMQCRCIPGRKLCGGGLFVNIDDFLEESIKGPASFKTISTEGGSTKDGSIFSEDAMNQLISEVFGEPSIALQCDTGECMHQSKVPGYRKPVNKINTPVVAGVIAGCGLFIVAVILLVWFLSSRSARKRYGPIHLSEDDDEHAKLMTDHTPTALHFQNVSYNLNGKQILFGVQGAVQPGELLAIMGASGAGKTTFLDILARKNKKGISYGDFYVNGEKIGDDEFRSVIGFVDQDDTMLPTLTVHETILDSAMLRLPKSMGLAAKEQRVEAVERELGIYHIRDQVIGSEDGAGRGISGGEKRRVGIACELVTSPSILFLDEPTSGLDSFNAFNVVECLVNLVKTYRRTVIFTIHQPRSNIVALFDQLILLSRGRAVYSGPFSSCQAYFDSIGFSCPPGFNIADYLVDLTMHAGAERGSMDFLDASESTQTRSSSVMAVKSIASTSNFSVSHGQYESGTGEVRRPVNRRKTSVKQQQEQQLFTRKKPDQRSGADTPSSARTAEDTPLDSSREASQAWLSLSKQSGGPPPQILEDPHHDAPDANATGTDLDNLIASYITSDVAASVRDDIHNVVTSAGSSNGRNNTSNDGSRASGRVLNGSGVKGYRKVGPFGQFRILSLRTWRHLYRNPILMLTHYAISIVLAVLLGYFFYGLSFDLGGFQNRLGLLFFILALFGFGSLTSLNVFSAERLLFVRERAKGYYSPIAYFAAKVCFDIVPLRVIPPIILGAIVYPMTGLVPAWPEFWTFILFLVLFNLAAAAICLFIGIVFKNGGLANLLGSLVMLFSLLFSGFLLNHDKIPAPVIWLQSISIFHYSFEGMIVNEVRHLSLTEKKFGNELNVPGATILSTFGFNVQALWWDAAGLAIFAGVFLVVAYVSMHVVLVERR